jgi:phage tail-like protein
VSEQRPSSDRRLLPGLESPQPIGALLPALYQEDDFAQRLTTALDEVLAPVLVTLDCLDAYFDPLLAPDDFLDWLAGWVGVVLDEAWPLQRQRELVSEMVQLYQRRGTVSALRELLRIYTGAEPEISDNGGVAWSREPGADVPGSDAPFLVVRAGESPAHARRLEAIVAAAKPAHVPHRVVPAGE